MTSAIVLWLHVVGNVFWVGGIVAVALVLLASSPGAKERGELATRLYLRIAVPGFVVSFLFGVGRLVVGGMGMYMKQGWIHGKLTFAIIAIALHHIIGAKAKKMAKGDTDDPGKVGVVAGAFALTAVLAVFTVTVLKTMLLSR